ncbi:hypothetical protein EDI_251800 [Entamoeba dispar SAW760]|uniref:Uncharacterized protein n=1 Tax=Entamoeba dispar (strain ATCC PRA-260 / SAW760) TaxID=370354 RepID=B0E702_ENTDS|nr:uncharacterized protein EDI_251800 [Entamoeba dispar SAW760]EDR29743.1 hypothetical protein EDI_251800 [Entamoeba dispar SAW760]|eukprot:EDR29743.1 hypothetical protein EDI_251800 [Entamoeba dispar SAW760]
MKSFSNETERFNFLIDSFKPDRMDPYDEAVAKNELGKWFKIKILTFKDGGNISLDRSLLAKILRERTEIMGTSIDTTLADKLLKASTALYKFEEDKERNEYINDVLTIKKWYEDYLDEPDNHLIGLKVKDEIISILEKYNQIHNIFEQLADNNIKYTQRGRIQMNSYESWRIMRKGSIIILKEQQIFGRVCKDFRIINENTRIQVYVSQEDNNCIEVYIKDIFLMPTESVNPSKYPSNNCGILVQDIEKKIGNEVINSFELVLIEGLKKNFDIDIPKNETLTRINLTRISQSYNTFINLSREQKDNFIKEYGKILKQKISEQYMKFGIDKKHNYYPSWKMDRIGISIDEYKWVHQKLDELKLDLQGINTEIEKQPISLLQQSSIDSFSEKRDNSIKEALINYLKKFGFIPNSFDDQVAMKCPKSIETIYSNKIILDKFAFCLYEEPSFKEFLKEQIEKVKNFNESYIKKLGVVLNELLNHNINIPDNYETLIKQANDFAIQNPLDPNSKGFIRIIEVYNKICYEETNQDTPLHKTKYGKIVMNVLYSLQNEFDSIYNMWGNDAFFKFHNNSIYEEKNEQDSCAWMQSIQQQLKIYCQDGF